MIKELQDIEHKFFEIDEDRKLAKIVLQYERPEVLFDHTIVSGAPLMRPEILGAIERTFALVSPKYMLDLTLRFDEMGTYSEENLMDALKKNFALEVKSKRAASERRSKLARGFFASGLLTFFLMVMFRFVWITESAWSEFFFYLFDIAATVSLYEAVTILSVEREEKQAVIRDLHKRFSGIHFEKRAG